MISIANLYSSLIKIWSRRWCQRAAYLVVSIVIIISIGTWSIQKFILDRWLIKKIDEYSRYHYGVGFKTAKLVVNPLHGRITIYDLSLGNDLFKAHHMEVNIKLLSLLHIPHIYSIRINGAFINLDKKHLDFVQLKKHHKERNVPKFRLDYLEINEGQVHIQELDWGVSKGDFEFQISGKGWDTNQLCLELRVPKISIKRYSDSIHGSLLVETNITDKGLKVTKGLLQTGGNTLNFDGDFSYNSQQIKLNTVGIIMNISNIQPLLPKAVHNDVIKSGIIKFSTNISGQLTRPSWETAIYSEKLRIKKLPIDSGNMAINLSGDSSEIRLNNFLWVSKNGTLRATGLWDNSSHSAINITGSNVSISPAATITRANFLKDATTNFFGKLILPPKKVNSSWSLPTIKQLIFNCAGDLQKNAYNVGQLTLTLNKGHLCNSIIILNLAEIKCQCEASGLLDTSGFKCIKGKANIVTNAKEIARMLAAWNIGKIDQYGQPTTMNMAGETELLTKFNWQHRKGILLDGDLVIYNPIWHMAHADRIAGKLSIKRDVLQINDMQLDKDNGRGYGDLWLSWGNLIPGSDQIDMHYRASQLPIKEGLGAADITNLAVEGNGDGWIRLHGPFKKITAEGQVTIQQSKILGLQIPAASTSFALDIGAGKLQVTNIRVADSLKHLGTSTDASLGPLDLYGSIAMDLDKRNWLAAIEGSIDSKILGIGPPYFQAQVKTELHGPFTTNMGPIKIPTGTIVLKNGSLISETQTLTGLEGFVGFDGDKLRAQLGVTDNKISLFKLDASQNNIAHMTGTLDIKLGPESVDTAKFATSLTNGIIKDAQLELNAQCKWSKEVFSWSGCINQLNTYFNGVNLVQPYPGRFIGDSSGVNINMMLTSIMSDNENKLTSSKSRLESTLDTPNIGLRGRLPFLFNDPSLSINMAGTSNLANLKSVVDQITQPDSCSMLANLRPDGLVTFNMYLSGTINETKIDGSLSVANGQLAMKNYPTSIDNLNVVAKFDGRDIVIPENAPLRGAMAQGTLTTWGKMTWNPKGIFYYDLNTNLDRFQLRDASNCLEIQGNLVTNLKGDSRNGGTLSGSALAHKALYHKNLNVSDLSSSNIVYTTNNISTMTTSDYLNKIDINLDVQLAEPLKLDTNFIKMQWQPKGPLLVKGTLGQPYLKGAIELLPGGLITNLFPTGDMALVRGYIEFTDQMPFDPHISIKGEMAIAHYLIALNVLGNASTLRFNFSSNPTLRQDQLLAALINPTAITDPTNHSGQLTQAVIGNGLSANLLASLALASSQEKLRQILNLDRINLSLPGLISGRSYTITVGKNLNILGYHLPLIFTHSRINDLAKSSGKVEWRFGNLALRLGVNYGTENSKMFDQKIKKSSFAPAGDICYTWSPK